MNSENAPTPAPDQSEGPNAARDAHPSADPAQSQWQVICLCADWCGTCREWRPQLAQEAARHPGVHFSWVDIEDQADAMGDIDVETFPTLLIAQGPRVRFLGPVLPSVSAIGRLLESLRDDAHAGVAPDGAEPLLARLRAAGPEAL